MVGDNSLPAHGGGDDQGEHQDERTTELEVEHAREGGEEVVDAEQHREGGGEGDEHAVTGATPPAHVREALRDEQDRPAADAGHDELVGVHEIRLGGVVWNHLLGEHVARGNEAVAQDPAHDEGDPPQGNEPREVLGDALRERHPARRGDARGLSRNEGAIGEDERAAHQQPAYHGGGELEEEAEPLQRRTRLGHVDGADDGVERRKQQNHVAGVDAHEDGHRRRHHQAHEARGGPTLHQKLDQQGEQHGVHVDGPQPVVLPPEDEPPAKGVQEGAEHPREGRLAVESEQEVKEEAREDDLQGLDEYEHNAKPRGPQRQGQGYGEQVERVVRPRGKGEKRGTQAVVEVPRAPRARAHAPDQLKIERDVLLEGI